MNPVRKWLQLEADERRYLVSSFFWMPMAALMLKVRGLQWTMQALSPHGQETSELFNEERIAEAKNVARMVNIAANRGFWSGTCLVRSLVLFHLLLRNGYSCELILGTKQGEEGFAAHAWVESHGVVLNDNGNVRDNYTVFEQKLHPES